MIATREDTYQAAVENRVASMFEAKIGQMAMDGFRIYASDRPVHEVAAAWDEQCIRASELLTGKPARTLEELF